MSISGAGWRFLLSARGAVFFVMAMACAGRLAAQSASFEVLQNLRGPLNGLHSPGPVIQGSDGNYYGTTFSGGVYNSGTVFKITPAGILTTIYSFTGGADGGNPEDGLTLGSDGNFYGTTENGGASLGDGGTVFKITPAGVLTTLYTFSGDDGLEPFARLTQGSDGNFYGTTEFGGIPDAFGGTYGTVFKITPAGVLTTLAFLGGANFGHPTDALIQGSDGNFYGTTPGGPGDNGYVYGIIFKVTPAGAFTTLYTFTGGADGSAAIGALTLGSDGNFYGITEDGGANGEGTVFKITPAGVLTDVSSLTGGRAGGNPEDGLTLGSDGNFYGTRQYGGDGYGAVFKMTPGGVVTTLYTFTGGADGAFVDGGLTEGSDGNFYGATIEGGANDEGNTYAKGGTVFKITPAGVLTTLHTFIGGGQSQTAGLTLGNDGNLYGTTPGGDGTVGDGTVFEMTTAGALTSIYPFAGGAGGATPLAPLTLGSDGNFYGTTYYGGDSNGDGTIFKVTPAGVLTNFYTFTGGAGGANPVAGLLQGNDGNFYGTTEAGGDSNGDGAVFKITPAGAFSILHTFTGGAGGAGPNVGLTLGNDGNFYGTTQSGGAYDEYGQTCGTVFKITPAGVFSTLYVFTGGADGAFPNGLTRGKDGNFYGITYGGGNGVSYDGDGTVFRITPAGVFTTLYTFTGDADGATPGAGLTLGADGNFYGTNEYGGNQEDSDLSYGDGTIFKITPAGVLTTLYTFAVPYRPQAPLALGSDGNFYGDTSAGGQYGAGIIFRLTVAKPVSVPAVTSATESAQVGSAFSFPIAATNDPTSFAASNLPAGLSVNTATGLISGVPTQTGRFPVGLSATNSIGTGSGTLALTVNPASPVITSPLSASGEAGHEFIYQIAASNCPTSCAASNLPPGLSLNTATGVISGILTQGGKFAVELSVSNAGGTGTATLALTIYPLFPPAITSPLSASGEAGHVFTYQMAASNIPTGCAASNLPPGLSLNTATGLISGIPTKGGKFAVGLSASNSIGTGTATLALTISPLVPPVITSALSASGQAGQGFTYQMAASNNPTGCAASNLPPGLSLNTGTGLISGIPTKGGTYYVGLSASNSIGAGTATLVLTISPLFPPVITSALSASGQVGQGFTYQMAATNNPTGCAATNLPPGLSLNTGTGLISGIPTKGGTYNVGLSASNSIGAGTATLVLTISPLLPPVITSALSASGQVGHAFAYQMAATNNPTGCAASNLPPGISLNTGTGLISGIPTKGGTYNVGLSASNSIGTGTATLALSISP